MKIQNRAFTLVEMLVAITIFLMIIGIISQIFISALRQQRKSLASQQLLDQTSYAMEYMSRALRMAKKDSSGTCLSAGGRNYEITNDGLGLKFINHLQDDDCQEFFLEQGKLKYRKKISQAGEELLDLTSNKFEITSLKFFLTGESQDDDFQPRVTIFLNIKERGQVQDPPEIKIQTTVSQRTLDVNY